MGILNIEENNSNDLKKKNSCTSNKYNILQKTSGRGFIRSN